MRAEALEVLDTDARIPYVRGAASISTTSGATRPTRAGCGGAPRWRAIAPTAPDWDVVIDVDELARADDENWVWAGADVIEPDHTVALISLSRGGSDAAVVREFDMRTRNSSRTASSCPRPRRRSAGKTRTPCCSAPTSVKARSPSPDIRGWSSGGGAGQPLDDAETLFSAATTDVIVAASVDRTPGFERTVRRASISSTRRSYELRGGELIRIDTPTDASISVHRNWLLIELRTDWFTGVDVSGRLPAGRGLRRVPRGDSRIEGGVRPR